MIENNQFGSQMPGTGADAKVCAQYEAMLADVVDGLLTPEQLATFDEHATGCAGCGVQLAEAQRGAAWMSMLKSYPPVPDAALVARILAETSVRTAAEQAALRAEQRAHAEQVSLLGSSIRVPVAGPVAVPTAGSGVLPFRGRMALRLRPITHTVLQPRFMMTAAMAFFSIALTLNVAGIRLNEIHSSDLRPSSLRRSFYQANAHVVRYYDNLRVVYKLESRVHDLQHSADENAPAIPYSGAPSSAPGSGAPAPEQKLGAPAATQPKSADPAGKKPDGAEIRRPDPKSGSSRRESPAPPAVQMAYASPDAWLGASALDAIPDAQNKFGRAL